jgi:hypothetical protein
LYAHKLAVDEAMKLGKPVPPPPTISSGIAEHIKQIQSYMSKHTIDSNITIRRNEGYEVFKYTILPDGTTLESAMRKAYDLYYSTGGYPNGDKSAIEKLKAIVNSGNFTAHQEHFMSATIAGPAPFSGKPVHWEMTVQKGSKGTLLEGINVDTGLQSETEILLQKDSDITIVALDFDYINGKWKPVGSLVN